MSVAQFRWDELLCEALQYRPNFDSLFDHKYYHINHLDLFENFRVPVHQT